MDILRLTNLIESNLDAIVKDYCEQINSSEYMKTYQKLNPEKLSEREKEVFKHLIGWLNNGANNDQAEKYFEKIGEERYREGFPLTELNYALFITKKVFWAFLEKHPELLEAIDKNELVKFFIVLGNYYDLAVFYIIRSYIQTLFERLDINDRLSREEIHNILVRGAYDEDDFEMTDFVWRHI
jgi:hypothetical protein